MINWDRVKENSLLLITWDDIVSDRAWIEDKKAQTYQPAVCKDVGWFLNSDKLNIRIFNSVNDNEEKGITVIPKGVIRKVQRIKYKRTSC